MKDYTQQIQVLHGDFSDSLTPFVAPNSVDCIVSGFAIHHLPHDKKKKLYAEIYSLLKTGGIFINIEHTASASPKLETLYDQQFIHHLATYNGSPVEKVAQFFRIRGHLRVFIFYAHCNILYINNLHNLYKFAIGLQICIKLSFQR